MLRAADMISSRLPDRFLRFHSSKCTVTFLSRNVSILHTLTPVSDFSDEQRDKHTASPSNQVELGFPNGNGRHRYKSRLVQWQTSASSFSTRALGSVSVWKWSSRVQVALGKMADFGERKENCRFSGLAA